MRVANVVTTLPHKTPRNLFKNEVLYTTLLQHFYIEKEKKS
jgi:hypothetical protein